ncbi:MAG: hypothetical protein ACU84H_15025 [Gammaproteobacteria bacterium]
MLLLPAALPMGLSLAAEPEGDPSKPTPMTKNKTIEPMGTNGFTPAMKDTISAYYKCKGCLPDMVEPVAGCP